MVWLEAIKVYEGFGELTTLNCREWRGKILVVDHMEYHLAQLGFD